MFGIDAVARNRNISSYDCEGPGWSWCWLDREPHRHNAFRVTTGGSVTGCSALAMVIYKFCGSQICKWKPSPPPLFVVFNFIIKLSYPILSYPPLFRGLW